MALLRFDQLLACESRFLRPLIDANSPPPFSVPASLFFGLLCSGLAHSQNGDHKGEEQPPLPFDLKIPAAPVLSVEEAMKSFRLAPGFEMEIVASEPLVSDPVCMAFDEDGRIWVAEMIAYMPNVDGEGETQPIGRIAVLEDSDGDGKMDSRSTFLDGLVLPRAVLPYREGALVITPPELAYHRDTDGDGVADTKDVIATGLPGIHSPEHAINGLRWTFDNWIQCSNYNLRFKETQEGWITERTSGGGQWGISLDEEGRAYFNTNSDGLRGDTFSSHYAVRNSNYGTASGMNVRVAKEQVVWPARMTPGVNRGYQGPILRDDFTLANFTGACGPLIYLGGAFPPEFHGNAFIAEPCGNLVKRFSMHDTDGLRFEARNVYGGREFLSSTDERFRPVNIYDGPDGAMYVVDMYRGLIQHRLFVTSWLRAQVEERGLASPVGMGRIWRVKSSPMESFAAPKLSEASWTELAAALHHPNGWWRLTAQRLIVQDGAEDADAIALTRAALLEGATGLGRMHALWTLQGLEALDQEVLLVGLADSDERVVRAAMRCAEEKLSTGDHALLKPIQARAPFASRRLQRQMFFSLGHAQAASTDQLMADWMVADAADAEMRSAVLSGLGQREMPFLADLFSRAGWSEEQPGRKELVRDLALCISREQRHSSLDSLLTLIVETAMAEDLGFMPFMGWRSSAMVEGLLAGRPKGGKGQSLPISFASEPTSIIGLRWQSEFNACEPLRELQKWITWPGGPNAVQDDVRALTDQEQWSFHRGREIYTEICAACHQSSGRGAGGLAPSLRFSPWLMEDKATPIRILLGGLNGEIEVDGQTWNLEMPVYDSSPEDVAAVLTYARREWGHGADPVTADEVRKVIEEMKTRDHMWTAKELQAARASKALQKD